MSNASEIHQYHTQLISTLQAAFPSVQTLAAYRINETLATPAILIEVEGITEVFKRRTKQRLPIDVQKIHIRSGAEIAVARLLKRAQARYATILGQEVNYELGKL